MKDTATSRAPSGHKYEALVALAHGAAGWALCAAAMGIAMRVTTLDHALILHAIAAPLIFTAISLLYFRRRGSLPPLHAAIVFLATVAALDFFVVALVIERSLAMFGSILGVWLPFLLIFVATWLTGLARCGRTFRSMDSRHRSSTK